MNEAYKDVRRLKMTLKTLEITWVEACCPPYTDATVGRLYSRKSGPNLADGSHCMRGIRKFPNDGALSGIGRCIPVLRICGMEKRKRRGGKVMRSISINTSRRLAGEPKGRGHYIGKGGR